MITITLFIWVIFLLMQDTSSGVEVSNVHEANLGVQSVEAADVEESGQSAQANENMWVNRENQLMWIIVVYLIDWIC